MGYARHHVRQALSAAREAGRDVSGLAPEKRETAVVLEGWGFLPVDEDAEAEKVRRWYVEQGLAAPFGVDAPRRRSLDTPIDIPKDTPEDTPERVSSSGAALAAAEAALDAARAALSAARTFHGSAA